MRDTGVDLWQYARFGDLADINPQRGTAEIERRDGETFVLAEGDLVHFQCAGNGILRRAANESVIGRVRL